MNVIVIGANRGLGFYLAKMFAEHNHSVIAGVFPGNETPEIEELKNPALSIQLLAMDVSSEESVKDAAQAAKERFGHIDVLINVAGVLMRGDREGTILDTQLQELRTSLEVNTVGTVIVMQQFLPVMREDGQGLMIMITSEAGSVSINGSVYPAYSISKTAANKAVFVFRASIGNRCRIYAMHPGRMNTEMGRTYAEIEPSESAESIYRIAIGEKPVNDNGTGFINYKGEPMAL
ncbi:SDR family NAD(P)-dependent oxidoreductase [Paenibacillus macerans]|uniref:SDR family NAD(P)-dependent oxidoreductase n=1 Tax=Paenibacillus macerans TaxID=44252 RepID=UPI003D320FF6